MYRYRHTPQFESLIIYLRGPWDPDYVMNVKFLILRMGPVSKWYILQYTFLYIITIFRGIFLSGLIWMGPDNVMARQHLRHYSSYVRGIHPWSPVVILTLGPVTQSFGGDLPVDLITLLITLTWTNSLLWSPWALRSHVRDIRWGLVWGWVGVTKGPCVNFEARDVFYLQQYAVECLNHVHF